MPFIDWNENEYLNIKILDQQHIEMTDLVNKMHSMLASNAKNQKRELIQEFIVKMEEHFKTEEGLMREHQFVNFISHKMEHDRIKAKMIKFKKNFEQGSEDINLELVKSLKTWFFNHNDLNDKKMGRYLYSEGVR